MKTISMLIVLLCSTVTLLAQQETPKNRWALLAETGINDVNSRTQINFCIGTEYLIANKSSITFRIKYFEIGIDYFKKSNGCDSFAGFFCSPSERFLYEGKVLKIPLNYKYTDKTLFGKLNYFVTAGFALNITLQEKFNKIINLTPTNNKTNINFNTSLGFAHDLTNRTSIYISSDVFLFGNTKSKEKVGFLFPSRVSPTELLFNIGTRIKL